jgi:hypothetical protein
MNQQGPGTFLTKVANWTGLTAGSYTIQIFAGGTTSSGSWNLQTAPSLIGI